MKILGFINFLIIFLLFCEISVSKVQKGDIFSNQNWLFLSKFCFDTEGLGNLTWKINLISSKEIALYFYDDVPQSWPETYEHKDSLTCQQKTERAIGNQLIINETLQYEEFIDLIRPHFWFVAIADCNSKNLEFYYEIEFINGGGPWSRQFSFDEQGVPQMYLVFWLVFTLGFAIHLRGVWTLHKGAAFHPIVQLLTLSIGIETISTFCFFIHFMVYKSDGIGSPGLRGLGEILGMVSQLIFMLLLVLLAKGWAISNREVSQKTVLIGMISVVLFSYITMFIWDNVARDPASTLYIYESAPGFIILVLRILILLYFLFCLKQTLSSEENSEKRKFYFFFWWCVYYMVSYTTNNCYYCYFTTSMVQI